MQIHNCVLGTCVIKVYCAVVEILIHTLRSVNDVTEGIAQESPMGDFWVIPRKVDKMVLPTTRQGRALLIGRRKRWVIPG